MTISEATFLSLREERDILRERLRAYEAVP